MDALSPAHPTTNSMKKSVYKTKDIILIFVLLEQCCQSV